MFIAQFFKASSLKKKLDRSLLQLGCQGGLKKCLKKSKKNVKNIFFCLKQISKCDTCFYTHFSYELFQIFFYTLQTFYRPVPYPMRKKKLQKILQITIYEKSKNFTVIVSQVRVLGQKNQRAGAYLSPPSLYRVKNVYLRFVGRLRTLYIFLLL